MVVKGKRVLVIGAARSGIAAAGFLVDHGASVYLNDIKSREDFDRQSLSELERRGVELILGRHPDLAKAAPELILLSPGVPLNIPPLLVAKEKQIPVWSEMELASRYTRAPMVVITGTNGKTTTTALIGQIFEDAGCGVFVGGNIGVPFISKTEELGENDVAVLEASSFQLETTHTFKPKVAIILNLTPDHLDRHGSFVAYIEAKAKIFANQDSNDWLILNWDDEETRKLGQDAPSRVIYFSRKHNLKEGLLIENGFLTVRLEGRAVPLIRPEEIFIKGSHNLENAMAAAAAGWVMGIEAERLKKSMLTFPGVPHRLEQVLLHNGVEYVNDSKGTNPAASIKALEAFTKPVVLIAGGKNKGSDFSDFAQKIKEKVKGLVLVGQAAFEIENAVKEVGFNDYYHVHDYHEAVIKASSLASPGDVVLLSPACASWDMFQNFEERGRVFKELVHRTTKQ